MAKVPVPLPKGWGTPAGAEDAIRIVASGADEVGEVVGKGGKAVKEAGKGIWRRITGGKSVDEAAGTTITKPPRKKPSLKNLPWWAKLAGVGAAAGGGLATMGMLGQEEPTDEFGFGLSMPSAAAGPDYSTIESLINQKYGMGGGGAGVGGGAGGAGGGYGGLRAGFQDWSNTLQGYGAGQAEALAREYGALAQRADQDAAEAEAIARMTSEDIGRIGRDYAGAALADITSAGPGGPTETTGLVPVSGELTDIPGRIADTSQIAADYVLRDLNLTRDDLAYMGNVARMMGPAYTSQLNNTINIAIANKKFELDQQIAAQRAADARAAAASAQSRRDAMFDQLIALESMRLKNAGEQSVITPTFINQTAIQFERELKTPRGRQALQAAGIDVNNPTRGFQQYLDIAVRGGAATGR